MSVSTSLEFLEVPPNIVGVTEIESFTLYL